MAYRKTLGDLTTAVRGFLDEATASFWTAAQITLYINLAVHRVWAEVKALKDDFFMVTRSSTDGSLTILGETYAATSFAIVAGTTTYTLPPDFSEMKLIEVITTNYEGVRFVSRDLSHPDMRAAMEYTTNIGPSTFYFDIIGERSMRIAPKSDTALDLRITYTQAIADLVTGANTEELTMPHPLYQAVIHYAVASAMMQDRDGNSAAHEARARAIIQSVFGAHARQTQDFETVLGYLE